MNNYSQEELEKWLKERTEQYMLYPSEQVWNNISKTLHPKRGWLTFGVLIAVFMTATTFVAIQKEEKQSIAQLPAGRMAFTLSKQDPFSIPAPNRQLAKQSLVISSREAAADKDEHPVSTEAINLKETSTSENKTRIETPEFFESPVAPVKPAQETRTVKTELKKSSVETVIKNVVMQAKKIGRNASFQFYITPSIAYRSLNGQASGSIFQYSQFFLSTNNVFAKNVKDVVDHRASMGLELGTSMLYPLSKRITLKAGIQGNYNKYIIKAYKYFPEIATLGMNNVGAASYPINTLSYYRNNSGYSKATLRNEHYMLSIPVGLDYRVAGNKALNFSVGSTLQPTFVFANYSYLLSSNLSNYAKAPSLNRRWNLNASMEASVNFVKGDYRWSIGPQYRYQLLSSFKDKYPIRENLMDFGVKVGVVKTIN